MTTYGDPPGWDNDAVAVQAGETDAYTLAVIAQERPDLWPQILMHPNTDPAWAKWIRDNYQEQGVPLPGAQQRAQLPVGEGAAAKPQAESQGELQGESEAGRRKRRRVGIPVLFAVMIVAAIGGGWLFAKMLHEKSSVGAVRTDTEFAYLPVIKSSVGIAGPDVVMRLQPLGQGGLLQTGAVTVARVDTEDEALLVAVEATDSEIPLWTAVLPDAAADCALMGSEIDCGSAGVFAVSDGTPSGQLGSVPRGSGDSEKTNENTAPVQVPVVPEEELHYTFDGTQLQDGKGGNITTFSSENVWMFSVPGSDLGIFSDGLRVVAVKGRMLLWEVELPAGSAAVNGFDDGDPRIQVDGTHVLLGEPTAMLALDLENGEEVWRLSANVDSWLSDGPNLAITADGGLYLAEFSTQADSEQTGGTPSRIEAVEVKLAPSLEELGNGSLEIPESCLKLTTGQSVDAVRSLVDGEVMDLPYDVGSVTLVSAETITGGGQPFTIATFSCFSTTASSSPWAIYDSDSNMVAARPPLSEEGLSGSISNRGLDDLVVKGSNFSYVVDDIGLAGDEFCRTCSGSGSATLTWEFDGTQAALVDTVYHLPTGEVRAPDQELLQQYYDAIAADEVDSVQSHLSPEMLAALPMSLGAMDNSDKTIQRLLFPPGGRVEQCILLSSSMAPIDANGVAFVYSGGTVYGDAGEWLCGVTYDGNPLIAHGEQWSSPNTWHDPPVYESYLIVTSDLDGNPYLVRTGRNFS